MDSIFTIPFDRSAPAAPDSEPVRMGAAAPGKRTRSVTLEWQTSRGQRIGNIRRLDLPDTIRIEHPGAAGAMTSSEYAVPLTFVDEPPARAAMLRVTADGQEPAALPVPALARRPARLPDPVIDRFGPATAGLQVPVIAERFVERSDFLAFVRQLHDWVIGQPPFDEEPTRSGIAFLAHFWPSNPATGLFGTSDDRCQDNRLFFGDREAARHLLAPWLGDASVSLILINSGKRGGAGGQPGYSAWTSITPAEGERWEAVCLHEIGHGFGLADEYLDSARQNEWPNALEPNISRDPAPSHAPWRDARTVGDEPAPTCGLTGSAPAGTIGTFQGARYRQDLYRAAETCLMRDTRRPFCRACQDHIVGKLSA